MLPASFQGNWISFWGEVGLHTVVRGFWQWQIFERLMKERLKSNFASTLEED
jgi:hypothetical protein